MAGGRPTDYRPEHCEQAIELGRAGKSKAQIAAALDVARNTLDNWAQVNPEFLSAMTRAQDLSQAWFEDKGQLGLETPGFNASLWAKQVSCRFRDDYTDASRREISGPNGGPIEAISVVERRIVKASDRDG